MVIKNAVEYPVEVSVDIADGNIDLYKAYIKEVECEFSDEIDELLETLNLSYLRVKNAKGPI
jgi:hypothetical protein